MIDYNSPKALQALLKEHALAMQKRFSQNFLVNSTVRHNLIDSLRLSRDSVVWEIGMGLGAMTQLLLEKSHNVVGFEIDRGFIDICKAEFAQAIKDARLSIIEGDFLHTYRSVLEAKEPGVIFGNLPYNVGTLIVLELCECFAASARCPVMLFMLQKEVAKRITARAGDANYGAISVLVGVQWEAKITQTVSGGSFWPPPEVASCALQLTRKKAALCGGEGQVVPYKALAKLVNTAFAHRRKTIRNNLLCLCAGDRLDDILERLHIAPATRPQDIRGEQYVALTQALAGLAQA